MSSMYNSFYTSCSFRCPVDSNDCDFRVRRLAWCRSLTASSLWSSYDRRMTWSLSQGTSLCTRQLTWWPWSGPRTNWWMGPWETLNMRKGWASNSYYDQNAIKITVCYYTVPQNKNISFFYIYMISLLVIVNIILFLTVYTGILQWPSVLKKLFICTAISMVQ